MQLLQIDAFTNQPFAGNPAAVCLLTEPRADAWMQSLAQEMNLSETAFLLPENDGYRLRWFTPTIEVDLCGHATLASAHALWSEGLLEPHQEARFYTKSGLLTAQQSSDLQSSDPQQTWIQLNFPANQSEAIAPPPVVLEALDTPHPLWVGKNSFDYLIELTSADEVRALTPNHSLLKTLPVRGVIVTSRADTGSTYDFISRFFAPGAGIDEDPVTGSAHCALGPYWAGKLGKTAFFAYQASARGGEMQVALLGDRVLLSGQAVTVLRGDLLL